MIGQIVSAAAGFGSQWLKNKGAIGQAKVDVKLATLKAEADTAQRTAELEMEVLRSTGSMDWLAVKQSEKSWFDEIICALPFLLVLFMVVEVFLGTNKSDEIIAVLTDMPVALQGLIGLIYVRYLGFRGLLRLALKLWLGGKGNGPVKKHDKPGYN